MRQPTVKIVVLAAVLGMLAGMLLVTALALAQQPVTLQFATGVVPVTINSLLFENPHLLKNYGKTYVADVKHFRGSAAHIPALAAKELDFSYMSFGSFAAAVLNAKLDLKIVAGLAQDGAPGYFSTIFAVRDDSDITTPADLKGKIVAVHVFGTGYHMVISEQLKKFGLTEGKDYRIIEVNLPNMYAMLQKKTVDLALFPPPSWNQALRQGNVRVLFTQKEVIGRDEILFQVVRKEVLDRHPKAVVDFLEDYLLGIRWFHDPANHQKALEALAKSAKRPVAAFAGWAFQKNDYYRDLNGEPLVDALQENLDRAFGRGTIPRKMNLKEHVDLSFLKQAQQRVGLAK